MSEPTAARITTVSRVSLIMALFVALIFCLVLLVQVQMDALTPIRAYVGGEGLWAKAQKDAVHSIEHYAMSRDEADYLATDVAGQSLTVYGGVIFSRAGQTKINTLSDIKGKTVAAVDSKSQGGYQMQAYELSRAGVRMPQDVKLITTGLPMGQVVGEVLAGRAEVGFVRLIPRRDGVAVPLENTRIRWQR